MQQRIENTINGPQTAQPAGRIQSRDVRPHIIGGCAQTFRAGNFLREGTPATVVHTCEADIVWPAASQFPGFSKSLIGNGDRLNHMIQFEKQLEQQYGKDFIGRAKRHIALVGAIHGAPVYTEKLKPIFANQIQDEDFTRKTVKDVRDLISSMVAGRPKNPSVRYGIGVLLQQFMNGYEYGDLPDSNMHFTDIAPFLLFAYNYTRDSEREEVLEALNEISSLFGITVFGQDQIPPEYQVYEGTSYQRIGTDQLPPPNGEKSGAICLPARSSYVGENLPT
jgi:hypothetical protein